MKNPFESYGSDEDYIDYVTDIELPPLPNGDHRSIILRLTLDQEKGHAYPSLVYEVEGNHFELEANEDFTPDLWREIVGAPTNEQKLKAHNAELLSALQSLILKLPDNSGYYQDAAEYRHIKSAVERAEAAIAKATTNS